MAGSRFAERRWLQPSLVIAILACAPIACQGTAQETREESFTVGDSPSLRVDNFGGNVTVLAGDEPVEMLARLGERLAYGGALDVLFQDRRQRGRVAGRVEEVKPHRSRDHVRSDPAAAFESAPDAFVDELPRAGRRERPRTERTVGVLDDGGLDPGTLLFEFSDNGLVAAGEDGRYAEVAR